MFYSEESDNWLIMLSSGRNAIVSEFPNSFISIFIMHGDAGLDERALFIVANRRILIIMNMITRRRQFYRFETDLKPVAPGRRSVRA